MGVEIAACLIGAFYAYAGFVATRAALTSHFFDRAIAAISAAKPSPAETRKTYWLLASAALVLAGGLALAFQLRAALWLFLLSAAGQALYLFYLAPAFFDAEDPPDAKGRRQTTNAFIIYLAATAFVAWASASGHLAPVSEADWRLWHSSRRPRCCTQPTR